ncbi:hypothetical protein B4Q14_27360 [Klebsiella pneumoniae]|nr:hypothetical protein B4Q14_27360 [Klebsiella pneumoniae]
MKTLSFDEMKRVSGAGHFGDVRDANMGKSNKNTGSNNKGNTGYYNNRHCCKVSDEAAFCLIQRPYISKTLLTRRISPRGSP